MKEFRIANLYRVMQGSTIARSNSTDNQAYRAEIDGLRAFAILPVLLVHAGFSFVPGGFIGVDVFFVISGYLITKILSAEIASDNFSLRNFYIRRMRRIMPALFVVIFASIFVSWFVMLPADLKLFGQSVVAVIILSSNILFAIQNGYFERASEFKPLLHTWSLGVEEQFYFLFPLALFFLSRTGSKARLTVFGLLAGISLIFSQFLAGQFPDVNFFILPGRLWELLAGALLALAPFDRDILAQRHSLIFQVLSCTGLIMILASYLFYDATVLTPSFALIPAILGSVLVLGCATPSTFAYKILSMPLFTGLGLISYSAYLWHQPIFVFARLSLDNVTRRDYLVLIILTLCFAYVTWRFVELPFRRSLNVKTSTLLMIAGSFSAVFFTAGIVLQVHRGFPTRFAGPSAAIVDGSNAYSPYRDSCGNKTPKSFNNYCIFGPLNAPGLAFVGDSFGKELFWRATTTFYDRFRMQPFLWNACIPFAEIVTLPKREHCNEFHRLMLNYIINDPNIETVVIVADWSYYINCLSTCIVPRAFEALRSFAPSLNSTQVETYIEREISQYQGAGKTVIIIGQVPRMPWNVPQHLLRENLWNVKDVEVSIPYSEHLKQSLEARIMLSKISARTGVTVVDPADVLCDQQSNRCWAAMNGRPLYFDERHLNAYGADLVLRMLNHSLIRPTP